MARGRGRARLGRAGGGVGSEGTAVVKDEGAAGAEGDTERGIDCGSRSKPLFYYKVVPGRPSARSGVAIAGRPLPP